MKIYKLITTLFITTVLLLPKQVSAYCYICNPSTKACVLINASCNEVNSTPGFWGICFTAGAEMFHPTKDFISDHGNGHYTVVQSGGGNYEIASDKLESFMAVTNAKYAKANKGDKKIQEQIDADYKAFLKTDDGIISAEHLAAVSKYFGLKISKTQTLIGKYYQKPSTDPKQKKVSFNNLKIVLKDKTTGEVLGKTTTDGTGKFEFADIKQTQGPILVEPQEIVGGDVCSFRFTVLPVDRPTLSCIDNEDPCGSGCLIVFPHLNPDNCTFPPCPWEKDDFNTFKKLDALAEGVGSKSPNQKQLSSEAKTELEARKAEPATIGKILKILEGKQNTTTFIGKYYQKPSTDPKKKKVSFNNLKIVLKDKTTGEVLGKTTTDGTGKFEFAGIKQTQGPILVEPQEPVVGDGCTPIWRWLPGNHDVLSCVEVEDPELRGLCGSGCLIIFNHQNPDNCTFPPCPWEKDDFNTLKKLDAAVEGVDDNTSDQKRLSNEAKKELENRGADANTIQKILRTIEGSTNSGNIVVPVIHPTDPNPEPGEAAVAKGKILGATPIISLGGGLSIPLGASKNQALLPMGAGGTANVYFPLLARGYDGKVRKYLSFGLNVGGGFSANVQQPGTGDYKAINIIGQSSPPTLTVNTGGSLKSYSYTIDAGPQLNFSIGGFMISPILNLGYMSISRNDISVNQTTKFDTVQTPLSLALYNHKITKSSGLAVIPKIRLAYFFGKSGIGIWVEGTYTYGPAINVETTRFVPNENPLNPGVYDIGLIQEGKQVTTVSNFNYGSFTVNAGICFATRPFKKQRAWVNCLQQNICEDNYRKDLQGGLPTSKIKQDPPVGSEGDLANNTVVKPTHGPGPTNPNPPFNENLVVSLVQYFPGKSEIDFAKAKTCSIAKDGSFNYPKDLVPGLYVAVITDTTPAKLKSKTQRWFTISNVNTDNNNYASEVIGPLPMEKCYFEKILDDTDYGSHLVLQCYINCPTLVLAHNYSGNTEQLHLSLPVYSDKTPLKFECLEDSVVFKRLMSSKKALVSDKRLKQISKELGLPIISAGNENAASINLTNTQADPKDTIPMWSIVCAKRGTWHCFALHGTCESFESGNTFISFWAQGYREMECNALIIATKQRPGSKIIRELDGGASLLIDGKKTPIASDDFENYTKQAIQDVSTDHW